ncbi:dihydroneopterin aldolase [Synechococcus sp. W2B2]|uniref:dihydroneopterin aldolase n=1 Tax=unclassified Synechococcus TaxID=2626047 RepID=UPI00006ADB9B|nr:dihydroneopterin aldolase [Synechococcus sp. WH 7805]EAR17493.1 Dihydroneopterin aldolase [Synechococcus sp. WH 7805]
MPSLIPSLDVIRIDDLCLWAHVGVLEHERRDGQWFRLDLALHLDLSGAAALDALDATADYSLAVNALQVLAAEIRCQTIEHFSERVFEVLESLYGALPMHLRLSKCSPPIAGFNGTVSIERWRNRPS